MSNEETRSRFVMLGGCRTHYTESGEDGPVIVALHGGGAGSSGEAGMAPLMRALPHQYRIIALDSVGGFGLTDPMAPSRYGLQSRVDHLEAFVDALCLDRFTIIGNSQGAWVAARYAILHPDRIERMILVGSATIGGAMGFEPEVTRGLIALQNYNGTKEGMRTMLEALVYDKSKITDRLVEQRFASASRPGAMEAFKAATGANRRLQTDPVLRFQFDMREALPAVTKTVPTIFIWGEDDSFALPSLGRKIEPLLPDVKFHWVPKAGHQVQNDQPAVVASIVATFMKG